MSTTEKKAKAAREARYFVNSEQVRGEPRVYFVVDRRGERAADGSSAGTPVLPPTTSKRTAERQCERLNMGEEAA